MQNFEENEWDVLILELVKDPQPNYILLPKQIYH